MSVATDFTGRKFGRLTVERRLGADSRGYATWRCRCDCGGKKVVASRLLTGGVTTSCGCKIHKKMMSLVEFIAFIDEKGVHTCVEFFERRVSENWLDAPAKPDSYYGSSWPGWVKIFKSPYARDYEDLTGRRFGSLVVVEVHGRRPIPPSRIASTGMKNGGARSWLCRCDCGNTRVCTGQVLRSNRNPSCGCAPKGRPPDRKFVLFGEALSIEELVALSRFKSAQTILRRLSFGMTLEKAVFGRRIPSRHSRVLT